VDGTVYLPTAGGIIALEAASGDELWRFASSEQPWSSAPVVHDGVVYVASTAQNGVHAVDAATGEKRWSRADVANCGPHLTASEYVDQPVLYAGDDAGRVLDLDPETGETRWTVDIYGAVSTFAFRPPTLYVGTEGGEVYALYEDGDDRPTERWRRKAGAAVRGLLPISEGVLVDTFGGPLRCLQDGAHAGTTRWTVTSKWANSAPLYADYTLYAAGYEGVSAITDYSGGFEWRNRGRMDAAAPVAAGDTLYATSGDAVHALDLTGGTGVEGYRMGVKRWSHETPSGVVGLAVGDGAVFAACEAFEGDTSLYCLEPGDE
jgi:outer membrane protein assembly factor BamB